MSPLEQFAICFLEAQFLLYGALVLFIVVLGIYQGVLDTQGERQND